MKKLIIAAVVAMSLVTPTFAAEHPTTNLCGIDYERAHLEQVPPRFCWIRQALGNQTFNGRLSLACEGSACKSLNNVLTTL